jgi:hypothetical protein
MTTDIAINGLYEHPLAVPMIWFHLLQYQWSSERETILNIIEVTANSIKMVW